MSGEWYYIEGVAYNNIICKEQSKILLYKMSGICY